MIIHKSLKLEPEENFKQNKNSSSRLALVFLELLERDCPIETIDTFLKLKTAEHYSHYLNIHINYLNRR